MVEGPVAALVEFTGGLGLFLASVNRIGGQTMQLGGRRLRTSLAAHASNPIAAPAAGMFMGALLQSSTGIIAILVGLIMAGIVSVPVALPMLLWANIGTSALVLIASIDLRLVGLAILSIAGIWLYFDRSGPEPRRNALEALFTLSLLMLGIGLMHTGTEGLSGTPILGNPIMGDGAKAFVMRIAGASVLLSILIGAIAAAATQSASGVAITSMAAFQATLLPEGEAAMVIVGAVFGSAASALAMGLATKRGSSRLLLIYQGLTKTVAIAVLLLLLLPLELTGTAWLDRGLGFVSADPSRRLALIFLLCETTPLIVQAAAAGWVGRALAALAPPAPEESLAHVRFLYPGAAADPDIALILAGKEQMRVIEMLPGTLPDGSPPTEAAGIDPAQLGAIGARLASEIGLFLGALAGARLAREQTDLLASLQSRNETLRSLHETMSDLTRAMQVATSPAATTLAGALAQGLGALLMSLEDAAQSQDAFDVELLLEMSSDRGNVVDGIRRRVLSSDGRIDPASQQSVYAMTSLFERAVWLIQRYAGQLRAAPERLVDAGA